MATKRLTNVMRNEIVGLLLTHKFKAQVIELMGEYAKFSEKVYNDVFPLKTRKLMESLPKDFLPETSYIKVYFDSFRQSAIGLEFTGRWGYAHDCMHFLPLKVFPQEMRTPTIEKLIPYIKRHAVVKRYDALDKLSDELLELEAKGQALHDDIRLAKINAQAAVNSATTVGALLKAWPELESILPDHMLKDKPTLLPAVPVKDLNTMFELPVEN